MAHNLHSKEIRKMYNLLYKYEQQIKDIDNRGEIIVPNMDCFLQTNDIIVDTHNKNNEEEATKHCGYFLFQQAGMNIRDYWLVRHLRDAIAHGFVEYKKDLNRIIFKDGKKKIKGEIPRELFVPLFDILYEVKISPNIIQKTSTI